jgi:CheY-like chemotaxis protein
MENRTTVLYVDDNPKSSRLLASVLEECGFRVICRNDPAEALLLCRRTYFDLALLDYEMPAMSGSRLAREIKHLVPEVPVVLISGRTSLPKSELEFVDAHFGFGTSLDDLLWTMRILTKPKVVVAEHLQSNRLGPRIFPDDAFPDSARDRDSRMTESRWADST